MNRTKKNIVISDLHCGSDRAVFPPVISLPPLMADEKERIIRYTNNQKKLYDHLMLCAKKIRKDYKGCEKIFTINGDAIEGIHHRTIQLSAPMVDDHILIHQQVMETFLHEAGFSVKNGDVLNYVSGTETHTGYTEQRIAQHFETYNATFHDESKLNQYGRNIWFVHQWKSVGNGANEGNSIVAGLKAIAYDSLVANTIMPDLVIASHYHKTALAAYTHDWITSYGIITPSFQMKTRFGQKVSAFQRNDIGLITFSVTPEGLIGIDRPMLMAQYG